MSRARSQQQILDALGQRIAQLRLAAGLTQDALSVLSEVDIQAIQRAETGRSALSFERLERVAMAMGATLVDLFDGSASSGSPDGWSADEALVVAALRGVPDERRALVLPLLKVLAVAARGPSPVPSS
jgi:transcriptional regulator with XRE-family HTH domain